MWDQVIHYLKAGYSPEQIAGTLTLVNAETPTLQVSHETIYTAIYPVSPPDPQGSLTGFDCRFNSGLIARI
ncbi:MAG: hypothetical protein ABI865_14005 [Nitrosospira sp.]